MYPVAAASLIFSFRCMSELVPFFLVGTTLTGRVFDKNRASTVRALEIGLTIDVNFRRDISNVAWLSHGIVGRAAQRFPWQRAADTPP
jgi:hypothetical protein